MHIPGMPPMNICGRKMKYFKQRRVLCLAVKREREEKLLTIKEKREEGRIAIKRNFNRPLKRLIPINSIYYYN